MANTTNEINNLSNVLREGIGSATPDQSDLVVLSVYVSVEGAV